jgi:hypothetical protein
MTSTRTHSPRSTTDPRARTFNSHRSSPSSSPDASASPHRRRGR